MKRPKKIYPPRESMAAKAARIAAEPPRWLSEREVSGGKKGGALRRALGRCRAYKATCGRCFKAAGHAGPHGAGECGVVWQEFELAPVASEVTP